MKNKLPNIVIILILTAITAVFWVFFNIYRSINQKEPVNISEEITRPLNPTLDTKILESIEARQDWENTK